MSGQWKWVSRIALKTFLKASLVQPKLRKVTIFWLVQSFPNSKSLIWKSWICPWKQNPHKDTLEPHHEKTCLFDQVRLKPTCAAIEASYRLEISDIETRDIILSRQRTTKMLIRLCGCAGWSAPLWFAYGINRFSDDLAHLIKHKEEA